MKMFIMAVLVIAGFCLAASDTPVGDITMWNYVGLGCWLIVAVVMALSENRGKNRRIKW